MAERTATIFPLVNPPVKMRSIVEIEFKMHQIEEERDAILGEEGISERRGRRLQSLSQRLQSLRWVLGQGWLV